MSAITILAGFITISFFGIGVIVAITKQWFTINSNDKRIEKVEDAVNEKIPEMLEKFKDGIIEKSNSVEKNVSEMRGYLKGMMEWMERNGRAE